MNTLLENTLKYLTKYEEDLESDELLRQKEDQLKRLITYINSDPQDDDINELKELKSELENEIKQLKDNVSQSYLTDLDLNKCLEESRKLIEDLYDKEFIEENDTNPSISFTNLNRTVLGQCRYTINRYRDKITTEIYISKTLKQYPKDKAMNTIIHEYIHSLKCCIGCKHYGKWKEIANKVNSSTDYIINEIEDSEASEYFHQAMDSRHKTVYHVICNHCGQEQKYYTANADIVKHPDRFSHRCKDGTRGTFRVDIEKR